MQAKQRMGNGWMVLLGCSGIFFLLILAGDYLLQVVQPEAIANMAVRQFDPGGDSASVRIAEHLKNMLLGVEGGILVIAGVLLLVPPVWKWLASALKSRKPTERKFADTQSFETGHYRPERRKKMTRLFSVLIVAGLLGTVGCKPYDVPEFEEIDTSETGFLIPLDGNTEDQSAFESELYLQQRKVATKRVQIPHRWVSTGRMNWTGTWLGTVRLVKVDRSPVTREWTADQNSGTSHDNQAIWIESKDSVGFSVGFNCTAYIQEEDTAKFLYMYRSKSLGQMMDSEIRARIQSVAAEVAARYDLDELRAHKQEIIDDVRKDLSTFFTERGITITTIGMFGGFTYQNASIQEAIDETFVAQQIKVIAEAKFNAQAKENERIELAAEGEANQVRTIAMGKADAIRKMAEATRDAQQDPLFLQLKLLEVETTRIQKWDGRYPAYLMQLGSDQMEAPQLMLQMPSVTQVGD